MSFEQDKRALYDRRRNIVYLIAHYLTSLGLQQTRQMLLDEMHLTPEYEVCDNVDLETIYQDFASYYQLKFGKPPRIVKRIDALVAPVLPQRKPSGIKRKPMPVKSETKEPVPEGETLKISQFGAGFSASLPVVLPAAEPPEASAKPLLRLHEHFSNDWKDLADTVCRDLIRKDLRQRWDQVKGLDVAVQLLKESVIAPLEHPELFTGITQPWRSILLHGAPGTGKTLLARTLCSETRDSITFFCASSSTLISKWRGESEKLIRVLYDVAKFYAPSIIFIDEFEGLASRRDSIGEHEASKRFKNEFLSLIDGLESGADGAERVFLLASTNIPWEIDAAFLRRFERKILIDVPDASGRRKLMVEYLPVVKDWREDEVEQLLSLSDGFTGDEVRIACKEALMMVIRGRLGEEAASIPPAKRDEEIRFGQLQQAFAQLRPNCTEMVQRHRDWSKKHGTQQYEA